MAGRGRLGRDQPGQGQDGEAVQLARLHGQVHVDWALGHAATYGRFADGDLASILAAHPLGDRRTAGEDHSLQHGTRAWEGFGR